MNEASLYKNWIANILVNPGGGGKIGTNRCNLSLSEACVVLVCVAIILNSAAVAKSPIFIIPVVIIK